MIRIITFREILEWSRDTKACIKAFTISMAISAIWYGLEYIQFGELQWDRNCDNVVWLLYYMVLWWALHNKEKDE